MDYATTPITQAQQARLQLVHEEAAVGATDPEEAVNNSCNPIKRQSYGHSECRRLKASRIKHLFIKEKINTEARMI